MIYISCLVLATWPCVVHVLHHIQPDLSSPVQLISLLCLSMVCLCFLTPPAAGWAHLRSTSCVWCHGLWRRSEIIVQCRCVPPLLSTQAQRNPAEHDPVLKSLPIHWPTVPGMPLECDLSQTLGNREKLFYFSKKKKRLGNCNTQSSFLSSPGSLYKPVELLWSSTSDSLRRIKWSTMRD